jgi:hypothetical protein
LFIQNRTTYSAAKLIQVVVSCLSAIAPKIIFWVVNAPRSLLISLTKLGAHAIVTGCLQRHSFLRQISRALGKRLSVKGESQSPEESRPGGEYRFDPTRSQPARRGRL